MPHKVSLATFSFVMILVLAVVAAGCGGGGGGDQSGNSSKEGGSGEKEKQAGGSPEQKAKLPEVKITLGKIQAVDAETRKVILRPTEGDRKILKIIPKAKITLDGKEAELSDVEKRQQAQIEYIVKEERNLARDVTLFSDREGSDMPAENGEKTG